MRTLRILRLSAQLHMQFLAVHPFMLFSAIVQPFFIAVTVMFMLRERPDFAPIFVVVGSALSGLWTVALFDGNWIIAGERWRGTLELLAGSPTPLMLIIAGRLIGTMAFSLISLVLSYVIGAWLFGYSLAIEDPAGFVISLAFALAALWATALLFAPLGILWRTVSQVINVLEYPVYIFGGFLFPILLLPAWSHGISYALPPYWAAVALHETSSGASATPIALVWAVLVLSTVVTVLLARPLFALVLRRASRDGTLALT
jgi:ABC-2 type transport system permease protein